MCSQRLKKHSVVGETELTVLRSRANDLFFYAKQPRSSPRQKAELSPGPSTNGTGSARSTQHADNCLKLGGRGGHKAIKRRLAVSGGLQNTLCNRRLQAKYRLVGRHGRH